jgi:hypothetical protein
VKKHKADANLIRKKGSKTSKATTGFWSFLTIGGVLAFLIGVVILVAPTSQSKGEEITVYKSPTCTCCGKWVDHLRDAGFHVTVKNRTNLGSVKSAYGVQPRLQSCHTALVQGYVVVGLVPAEDIKRMLQEKPSIAGLAVPGMPMGSPGMEGAHSTPYDVFAFDKSGQTQVYAKH